MPDYVILGKVDGIDIRKYDVVQIDDGDGAGWKDFATIKDSDDATHGINIVKTRGKCNGFRDATYRIARRGEAVYPATVSQWQGFSIGDGFLTDTGQYLSITYIIKEAVTGIATFGLVVNNGPFPGTIVRMGIDILSTLHKLVLTGPSHRPAASEPGDPLACNRCFRQGPGPRCDWCEERGIPSEMMNAAQLRYNASLHFATMNRTTKPLNLFRAALGLDAVKYGEPKPGTCGIR